MTTNSDYTPRATAARPSSTVRAGRPAPNRAARLWPAAIGLLTLLGACNALDNALAVDTPSRLPATALDDPANASLLVNSAVGDFDCALGAFIVVGGLMTDELEDGTPTASRWSYDRRVISPSESHYSTFGCEDIGAYTPISTARFVADDATRRLEGWTDEQVPNRRQSIAKTTAYAGYSLVLLGEAFCSAAVDEGPELTSAQIFALAEERFTKALAAAQASGAADLVNLAYAGRARARLDQGKLAEAAADARLVPANFVYTADYDETSGRRNNRVYSQNNRGRSVTVAPAFRNLTYAGKADPRVAVTNTGEKASDQKTPLFLQTKYAGLAASLPIARGTEARLIIAEAVGGAEAVGIINALHAAAGLAPFAGGTEAQIQAQVRQERARELFLEGQHLFDARRFELPFDPPVGTPYTNGGSYGSDRCMPLPDVERLNNPNIPDA